MDQTHSMGDAKHEGRQAFRAHGVGAETRHGYPQGSPERMAFLAGVSDEQFRAAERAGAEAVAYHALTEREAPKDRAWAERLAGRQAAC